MKKFLFAVAAAAMASAVSCTKEQSVPEEGGVNGGELVPLTVSVSAGSTRATGVTDESEKGIGSLQVFIFSEDLILEKYGSSEASSVTLSCYSGKKDIVAVANAGSDIDWLQISKKDDLDRQVSDLAEDNAVNRLFMYGDTTVTVSASVGAIDIPVTRRVARIVLKQIANEIKTSTSLGSFVLDEIYLINVAGDTYYSDELKYSPEIWYNAGDNDPENDGGIESLLYDSVEGTAVTTTNPYDTEHCFYCYPNPYSSGCPTRLVVKAAMNDRTWYYPVTIEDIQANTSYEIALTVTGAGAESPDTDPQNEDLAFNITVRDWVTLTQTETL